MTKRGAEVVLRTIQAETTAAVCDRELLRRFAGDNDQRAFAALFQRHGAMVLGVCRRALSSLTGRLCVCRP